jgi:hypothetical protein
MNKMQLQFLPQIRQAGCDETLTTFALACSVANSSLTSAKIAQLWDHDFSSANLRNARRPGPE